MATGPPLARRGREGASGVFMSNPISVPKSGPFACEDVSRPVRIAEPGGTFREQPVVYRCKGLVVTNNTPFTSGPNWDVRRQNGWFSNEMWSVTHEATGTSICSWEAGFPAVAAAQVLLALPVDWSRGFDEVRRAVSADLRALQTISALRAGRMVMVERKQESR